MGKPQELAKFLWKLEKNRNAFMRSEFFRTAVNELWPLILTRNLRYTHMI